MFKDVIKTNRNESMLNNVEKYHIKLQYQALRDIAHIIQNLILNITDCSIPCSQVINKHELEVNVEELEESGLVINISGTEHLVVREGGQGFTVSRHS